MALKNSLILFPLLALLLLVLGWVDPSLSQPAFLRFTRQHIDPSFPSGSNTTYCDVMMQRRNMTWAACKPVNTFVHTSNQTVINVCHEPLTRCKNGSLICHESSSFMIVTVCVLKGGAIYPNCSYWTNPKVQPIKVVCSGNPPLPVHLDM